jgi:hypothetical protein
MKTHNEKAMKSRSNVSSWVRSCSFTLLAIVLALFLSAGCSQAEGSACNPALSHNECDNDPTVQCLQPSTTMYPNCFGNAYCCTVTYASDGVTIIDIPDKNTVPNCAYLWCCVSGTCGEGGTEDGGTDTGATADTGTSIDTGTTVDTGTSVDTGTVPESGADSTVPMDSAVSDATGSEAG